MPEILLVIINWNGRNILLECLDSIRQLNYPGDKMHILVIDNASEDGSQQAVRSNFPGVSLIENCENNGYVNAVNQGIEHGLSIDVDYIWVFNNDVVVHEDCLNNLVAAGQSDETIGVVGPVIYSYDTPETIDHAGYSINFWTGRLKRLRFGEDVFTNPDLKLEDVDSILGCSNLIKTSVFRGIGNFKNVYHLYFEETDFNTRAKRTGFRVAIVRDARVWHKEASTMNRFILRRAWLLLRNLFIFEILNAQFFQLLVFIPYYLFIHIPYFLIRGSIYVIRTKYERGKISNCEKYT